jgi:branched-chain amino acid transport system ATP-binding protein
LIAVNKFPPVLALHDVSRSFAGFLAVDDVSFMLEEGERRALIGPNGAGKTTLFNLISGRLRPSAGEIHYRGQPIHNLPPDLIYRFGIARTFQITSIYPRLTALENVQVALFARHGRSHQLFRRASKTDVEEAMELLSDVGLKQLAAVKSGVLSYGDQKRLELAIVLSPRPNLLLLDEPTAGMDGEARRDIIDLVKRLCVTHRLTLLFCEHDMDAVFSIADKITVLHQGRVLTEGPPDEVRNNTLVREVYLGSRGGGSA